MIFDLGLLAKIFAINLSYVTLNTIRFMLTMKGYRILAPLLSMVEIVIYVLGLSMVMNSLDNPLNLAAYALGYGAGIGIGIKIEDWLALGYTMITVMTQCRTNCAISATGSPATEPTEETASALCSKSC